MSDAIVIRLVGEPRGKGRHRSRIATGGGGRQFIRNHPDPATEKFEDRLRRVAAEVMGERVPLTGALQIAIWAYRSTPASLSKRKRDLALLDQARPTTKPDVDNYLKLACDALNKIVWRDDAIVVQSFGAKLYAEKPALVIRVEPWVPVPPPSAEAPRQVHAPLFAEAGL